MTHVTFSCPACDGLLRASLDEKASAVTCPRCQQARALPGHDPHSGHLRHCLVCPSSELFVRKDFPQRWGAAIVIAGFALSCVFWAYEDVIMTFAVLFATALIDVLLYLTMGNVLECYRCHAQYRGLPEFEDYEQFDLEAYEKHRQQSLRLKKVGPSAD